MKSIIKKGDVFNRLTAIEFSHKGVNSQKYWLFECSCGKKKIIRIDSVKNGHTKSCGCLGIESRKKSKKTCIVDRCNNYSKCKGYCRKHYMQIFRHGSIQERNRFTPNEIKINKDICLMYLYNKQNKKIGETIFNKKHIEKVKKYKWSLSGKYIMTQKKGNKIYLHRLIKPNKKNIDHIDRNPLNNLDKNLRIVEHWQNMINKNSKNYCWDKKKERWSVYICFRGDIIRKYVKNKKEAIKLAYKLKKERHFKTFGEIETFNH